LQRRQGRFPQVPTRIDPSELRRFDQAVEQRRHFGPAPRPGAEVVLAADHGTAQRALGGVVVERDSRIVEEADEPRPEAEQIADRFAERALGQGLLRLLERPGVDLGDDRSRALVAKPGAGFDRASGFSLDSVERLDPLQNLPAGFGEVRLGLDELPACVRPAVGQREGRLRTRTSERVLGSVAVGDDDPSVIAQDLPGCFLRTTVQDPVDDRFWARERPGPPATRDSRNG